MLMHQFVYKVFVEAGRSTRFTHKACMKIEGKTKMRWDPRIGVDVIIWDVKIDLASNSLVIDSSCISCGGRMWSRVQHGNTPGPLWHTVLALSPKNATIIASASSQPICDLSSN
jgi:hypothetical protein